MSLSKLKLRKGEENRVLRGHPWIYSNEVDVINTPLKTFTPGELAVVESAKGKLLGLAYVNPHSLICARIMSHDPHRQIDVAFFQERFSQALAWRQQCFAAPYYRLVYGESDNLPGLTIDRYDQTAVVQITTAGMEQQKSLIIEALSQLGFTTIYCRNTTQIRSLENLTLYNETALGELPENLTLYENGIPFSVSLSQGQKTGWFYDHRDNRQLASQYAKNKRVLDVFSYVGGWGLQLLANGGARHATFIESSAAACQLIAHNAENLKQHNNIKLMQEDAFAALQQLQGEQFDLIVLDPPAFIKRRKDLTEGKNAYHRLNQLALKLLAPQGIIVTASCSMHLMMNDLQDILTLAGNKSGSELRIIGYGDQGADHPIHPMIPETAYLKAIFAVKQDR